MPNLDELKARMQELQTSLVNAKTALDEARVQAEPLRRFLPDDFFPQLAQARNHTQDAATLARRK